MPSPHLSDEAYRAAVKELTKIAAAFSEKDRADGTLSALRDGSLQRAKGLVLSGGRIKTEELRSEIGVSRAALRSLTLKHCGLSPSAFIAETNMLAAEDRLMNTEMSVFDIAAELGYSYRPFLRFFERHCGVTPSVFRISTYGEYRAARGRKDLPFGPF